MTHTGIRKRYWRRKREGICTGCGLVPPRKDLLTCKPCGGKYRNHNPGRFKERYHKLKEKGLCTNCGISESLKNRGLCQICFNRTIDPLRVKQRENILCEVHPADLLELVGWGTTI